MGFLSDIVHGKEKKVGADPLAGDINASGKAGLGYLMDGGSKLSKVYNQDPTQIIHNQIASENRLLRRSNDEALRSTNSLISNRGMGSSSLGLSQEINQRKDLNTNMAMNTASGMARLRDMQIKNSQGLMETGNSLWNVKSSQGQVQMNPYKYRTGGYGEVLATGLQAGIMAYANRKKDEPKINADPVAMNYSKGAYEGYA